LGKQQSFSTHLSVGQSGLFQNLVNAAVPVQNKAQQLSFRFLGCCATVHWVLTFYQE